MADFKDINPGQYIWFAKQGQVGQVRVIDVDKKNNKLYYNYFDNTSHDVEIDFDYNLSQNGDFYPSAELAFDAARKYNNLWIKDIQQGMFGTEVIYKTPDEVDNTRITQMLLD